MTSPSFTDTEQHYRQHVSNIFNHIALTGMPECDLKLHKIPLDKLFIKLNLKIEKSTFFKSPINLEPELGELEEEEDDIERFRLLRFQKKHSEVAFSQSVDITTALQQYRHLAITGVTGSGKSTLLRWLAVTFANQHPIEENPLGSHLNQEILPILLEFRKFYNYFQTTSKYPVSFDEQISLYVSSDSRFYGVSETWVREALVLKPCLLLLDGLDDIVAQNRCQRVLEALEAFLHTPTYANIRCVLTSRPYGLQNVNLGGHFQCVQLQAFSSENIKQFIHCWYEKVYDKKDKKEAQELVETVTANERTKTFAQNPLLCTFINIIYHHHHIVPKRRVELYLKCYETLLDHWIHDNADKLTLIETFKGQMLLDLLMPIAYQLHEQTESLGIPEKELVKQLSEYLTDNIKKYHLKITRSIEQEARNLMIVFRDRGGILQKRNDNTLEFTQHSFREYLAARYLAAQSKAIFSNQMMMHLYDARWQTVHLLALSHLGLEKKGVEKVTRFLAKIVPVYKPPSPWLLPDQKSWLSRFDLGKRWPSLQWRRRIEWHLMREFELVAQVYADCAIFDKTQTLSKALSEFALKYVSEWLHKPAYEGQLALLITMIAHYLPHDIIAEKLRKALSDKTGQVRCVAATCLGQLGHSSFAVIDALLNTLPDKQWEVRYTIVVSLGQLGQASFVVIDALLGALQDKKWPVRRAAAMSLGQLADARDAVIDELLEASQENDRRIRTAAIMSLGHSGQTRSAVINALLSALQDKEKLVRSAAATSLAQLGSVHDEVVEALLEAFQDKERLVQTAAATALGQLNSISDDVIDNLLNALKNEKWSIQRAAATSLGQLGYHRDDVIDALLDSLQNNEWPVRRAIIVSLGQLAHARDEVVDALLSALQDNQWPVRRAAIMSLVQLGQARFVVIEMLLNALYDSEWPVRSVAAASLGYLSRGGSAIIEPLLNALQDEEWPVQRAAAISLGKNGQARSIVIDTLLAILEDQKRLRPVRRAVANSLGQLKINNETQLQQVLIALNHCLHDSDYSLCRTAFEAICKLVNGRPIQT